MILATKIQGYKIEEVYQNEQTPLLRDGFCLYLLGGGNVDLRGGRLADSAGPERCDRLGLGPLCAGAVSEGISAR